tara:strand:+ start:1087 stop:1281 length:195 start_codon:yes stop_codon:yes gene_type:complete
MVEMMKKKGYRMGGKPKGMRRGGKPKGMKRGGKPKSKMMSRGGAMSLAKLRAAATKKGYKLVKK